MSEKLRLKITYKKCTRVKISDYIDGKILKEVMK